MKEKVKVLIAEDEAMLASLIMLISRRAGITPSNIDCCNNLEDTLQHIECVNEVGILITDWNIPRGNEGGKIIEAVRKKFPKTQIIVMTGNPNNLPLIANEYNPDEFLPKPFTPEELTAAIQRRIQAIEQAQAA